MLACSCSSGLHNPPSLVAGAPEARGQRGQLPPCPRGTGAARGQRVPLSWQYYYNASPHCLSVVDSTELTCTVIDNMSIISNCRHTLFLIFRRLNRGSMRCFIVWVASGGRRNSTQYGTKRKKRPSCLYIESTRLLIRTCMYSEYGGSF